VPLTRQGSGLAGRDYSRRPGHRSAGDGQGVSGRGKAKGNVPITIPSLVDAPKKLLLASHPTDAEWRFRGSGVRDALP
jgi:hypothetical protein